MYVSGLELMGALGSLTFRSWNLINVEKSCLQKKKLSGRTADRIGWGVRMGKVGLGFMWKE